MAARRAASSTRFPDLPPARAAGGPRLGRRGAAPRRSTRRRALRGLGVTGVLGPVRRRRPRGRVGPRARASTPTTRTRWRAYADAARRAPTATRACSARPATSRGSAPPTSRPRTARPRVGLGLDGAARARPAPLPRPRSRPACRAWCSRTRSIRSATSPCRPRSRARWPRPAARRARLRRAWRSPTTSPTRRSPHSTRCPTPPCRRSGRAPTWSTSPGRRDQQAAYGAVLRAGRARARIPRARLDEAVRRILHGQGELRLLGHRAGSRPLRPPRPPRGCR